MREPDPPDHGDANLQGPKPETVHPMEGSFQIFGNGAIVSTRSVVVADVPAYAIAGGNPARVIRPRFDPDKVRILESLAWWDWPIEAITRHLDLIVGGDVDALRRCAPPPLAPGEVEQGDHA